MESKICSCCKIKKSLDEFYNASKSKDGKTTQCKICIDIKAKSYKEKNIDKIKQFRKDYHQKNRNEFLSKQKKYCEENREKVNKKVKECYSKNKDKYNLQKKEYYEKNKEWLQGKNKENYLKNRDEFLKYKKEWHSEKRKNPDFKLVENLNSLFREKVKKENYCKIGNLFDYIEIDELAYIEHMRKSEHWNNYVNDSEIQIDHIIPMYIFNFNNPDDIKKCWHYQNLRLTTRKENRKKHNILIPELIEKYNISHLLPEN